MHADLITKTKVLGKQHKCLVMERRTQCSTPGHTGIQGNEKADILAKSRSALNYSGPKPFILIPYVSCRVAIKDWRVKDGKRLG